MSFKQLQLEGELFEKVQLNEIFEDQKTFVDSIPKVSNKLLIKNFKKQSRDSSFDLKNFVNLNFTISPELLTASDSVDKKTKISIEKYIEITWNILQRTIDNSVDKSTLIKLPYKYIVAGGRFREMYYWDSYFTCLGLLKSNKKDLIIDICNNFSYLINKYGLIPNGNRTYFLGRSQPPFFSLLIDLIFTEISKDTLKKYVKSLEKEYAFWMKGSKKLKKSFTAINRVVKLDDNSILNRYYDDRNGPREESYLHDYTIAKQLDKEQINFFYKSIRAGAESGWDFSSRWLKDGKNLDTIRTIDIVPVDLNCLLYNMEVSLSKYYDYLKFKHKAKLYKSLADRRKESIIKYLWNEKKGYFFDYLISEHKQLSSWTLAGMYPLFFNLADSNQATKVKHILENKFLYPGGLVTTLKNSGQQWDYPNGWAPLQWLAIRGLEKYGFFESADEIKNRWIKNCTQLYNTTENIFEKYNVVNPYDIANGGEYKVQEGFGWSNGVYLDLTQEIPS